MNYLFGEEIEYSFELLKPEDITILQAFSCGNTQMDYTIHNELIKMGESTQMTGYPLKCGIRKPKNCMPLLRWLQQIILFCMPTKVQSIFMKEIYLKIFLNLWKRNKIWK